MAKYVFAYHLGTPRPPMTAEETKKVMDAWSAWFASLGAAVIDGGNPTDKSSTVRPDGSLVEGGGANPICGYSLIEASNLEDAHKKAKACPILKNGGSIEIARAIDM